MSIAAYRDPMNRGIYAIRNTVNGKQYIGSAMNILHRWKLHKQQLQENRHHSVVLQRAWNKYGEAAFVFEKRLVCAKEMLITYEQSFFDAFKPEYNACPTAGSQLGRKHSPEARAKMSASRPKDFSPMKGRQHTEETKARISATKSGVINGPHSEETKAKISAAHKGREKSLEHRAKIAATLKGHVQSAEQIEKRAQKLRGRKMDPSFGENIRARMLGTKCSPERREANGRAKAKLTDEQVRQIRARKLAGAKSGDLAKEYGVDPSVVSDITRNKSYKWVD